MIIVTKKAEKFISRQSKPLQNEIAKAFMLYPNGNVKKLKHHSSETRIRIGKFRIICEQNPDGEIKAVMAGVRGDIYKHARSRRKRIEQMRRKEFEKYESY